MSAYLMHFLSNSVVKTLLKTKPDTELEDLYNHYKNTGEVSSI